MNILVDVAAHPLIGHRGAPAEAPENTLPSFQQAALERADLVELDVTLSADGAVRAAVPVPQLASGLLWGLDSGVLGLLAIGIPYVLLFYLLIAALEDSGYLTSLAVLTDRLLGGLGLSGRTAIPLLAATACNVPAIYATRVLATRRERILASFLVTLVPCSARSAVVVAALVPFAGAAVAAARRTAAAARPKLAAAADDPHRLVAACSGLAPVEILRALDIELGRLLDALDAVIATEGPARAHYLLERLRIEQRAHFGASRRAAAGRSRWRLEPNG